MAELDALHAEVDALKRLQAETAAELDALLPALIFSKPSSRNGAKISCISLSNRGLQVRPGAERGKEEGRMQNAERAGSS